MVRLLTRCLQTLLTFCLALINRQLVHRIEKRLDADCLMPIVQRKAGSEYFFANRVGQGHLSSKTLPRLMKELNMTHTFHETRHTCITMLTEADVDERIIRTIVGHAGESLTEKVYTHISIQPLLDAVNKLPVYKD